MTRVRRGCPDVVTVKPGEAWTSDLNRASLDNLSYGLQRSTRGGERVNVVLAITVFVRLFMS